MAKKWSIKVNRYAIAELVYKIEADIYTREGGNDPVKVRSVAFTVDRKSDDPMVEIKKVMKEILKKDKDADVTEQLVGKEFYYDDLGSAE